MDKCEYNTTGYHSDELKFRGLVCKGFKWVDTTDICNVLFLNYVMVFVIGPTDTLNLSTTISKSSCDNVVLVTSTCTCSSDKVTAKISDKQVTSWFIQLMLLTANMFPSSSQYPTPCQLLSLFCVANNFQTETVLLVIYTSIITQLFFIGYPSC